MLANNIEYAKGTQREVAWGKILGLENKVLADIKNRHGCYWLIAQKTNFCRDGYVLGLEIKKIFRGLLFQHFFDFFGQFHVMINLLYVVDVFQFVNHTKDFFSSLRVHLFCRKSNSL